MPPSGTGRPAVIVLPGGGYGARAPHEGAPLAWLFAQQGFVAAVCHYRVSPNRFPAPYSDTCRAVRMLREKGAAWGVDPDRIGLMGFSAGGHLAGLVGTQPGLHADEHDDLVGVQDARPNRLILCYPVVSFVHEYHGGSAKNLLGDDAEDEVIRQAFSNELHVSSETPPTFIFHTADDPGVLVSNATSFAQACWKHDVKAALHVYATGPHGVGLARSRRDLASWSQLMIDWLDDWER